MPPKIKNVRVHRGEKEGREQEEGNAKQVKDIKFPHGKTFLNIIFFKKFHKIFLDFDVEYLGDCDLQASLFGIPNGIK